MGSVSDRRRSEGEEHPGFASLEGTEPRDAYAWYVRIPDLPGFVMHVAPALERHLAESDQAGASGTLAISRYREGIVLHLEDGRIREVTTFRPSTETLGDVAFPDLNFLNLLLGHRSFDTLHRLLPDCVLQSKAKRPLIEALFPPRPSFIMATS